MRNHTGSHRIEGGADLAEKRAVLRLKQAFEDFSAAAACVRCSGGLRYIELHSGIVLAVIGIEFETGTGNDTQPPPFGITGGHKLIDDPDRCGVAFISGDAAVAVFEESALPFFCVMQYDGKGGQKFFGLKSGDDT